MNTIVKPDNNALPAHLGGVKKTSKIGNIDSSDLIIPRVKLLQAISPEIDTYNTSKAGNFWHTVASSPMGGVLRFIPIMVKKSVILWTPRNDDRGVLARSSDGVNWDEGYVNKEFTVKPKDHPESVVYRTLRNVKESGLAEFGSSVPGDPRSKPAASLTYNMLLYFVDFPDLSPAVVINTRSSIKPAKQLLSKIDMRPVEHFAQVFEMSVSKESMDGGFFYNYSYTADGYATEQQLATTSALFERFSKDNWAANDELDDSAEVSTPAASLVVDEGSRKY